MSVLLYSYIKPELFEQFAKDGVGTTVKIALLIIPVFLMIEFGISIVKYLTGNGNDILNLNKFFGYILIWFFTFQYMPVMNTLGFFVDAIESSVKNGIDPSQEGLNQSKTIAETGCKTERTVMYAFLLSKGDQKEIDQFRTSKNLSAEEIQCAQLMVSTNDLNAGSPEKTEEFSIARFFTISGGLVALLIEGLNAGVMAAIRVFLELISALLTTFLLIVGPFAIAFNMMPFSINEGVLKNWFATWFSIKCWMITVTLIDYMHAKLMEGHLDKLANSSASTFLSDVGGIALSTVVSCSFVVMYIITPYLTNLYTKGSGGQFLSLFVGTAAMAAKAATKAASGGAGGGGGGA